MCCVFKLGDRMRSMRTNGASKNRFWIDEMGPFSFITLVLLGVGSLGFLGVPGVYTYCMHGWNYLTYNLLTNASFRIGVPSILFVEKNLTLS